jgi:hypothetical protein
MKSIILFNQADQRTDQTHKTYTSPFISWDRQAAVRSFVNTDDEWSNYSGYWMPTSADNILSHPLIPDAIKQSLSAYLLIGSLDFTYDLEQKLISHVSSQLASGTLLPDLPNDVKIDALKIQCDEAFHALQAQRLATKVRQTSCVNPDHTLSCFLRFVAEVTNGSNLLSTELLLFCAVVVSETLITKSLLDDWRDSSLPNEIRHFFHLHYKDEVQHSLYFTWLLHHVCTTWSTATQQMISDLWPKFIDAYLDSDINIAKRALQEFDLAGDLINRIIHETYYQPGSSYQIQRQLSMVYTLKAFERVK